MNSPKEPDALQRLWVTPVRMYLLRLSKKGKLLQITECRNEGAAPPSVFLQHVMEAIPELALPARKREFFLTETPLAVLPQVTVQNLTPLEAARFLIKEDATANQVIFFPEPQTDWGALLVQTRDWASTLDNYWPEYQIRHGAGLIWEALQAVAEPEERSMWVQMLEERTLLIAATVGGKLRLLNAYFCRDEADRPYFVQAVRDALGWKNEAVTVYCAGELMVAPPPGWLQWEGLDADAPRTLLRPWPSALAHSPWWRFAPLLTPTDQS